MATPTPAVTLDTSGMSCPAPLLGAKKVLDDLQLGQVLLLISNCPGTSDDLFAWVKYTDHQIALTVRLGDNKTGYYIQKGKEEESSRTLSNIFSLSNDKHKPIHFFPFFV